MKRMIVRFVEALTFGRVRGQHPAHGEPSLSWWYVRARWAGYFCASNWISIRPGWLFSKWRYERARRARVAERRRACGHVH